MKKKIFSMIRVFIGISIPIIILHYVYTITNLTKDEISIPSLSKEEIKTTDTIRQGETFSLEGFTVRYTSFESDDEHFILKLEVNQKKKFMKLFSDNYSIYALNNNTIDCDISNYVENNTIYLPKSKTSNFDQLMIVKNIDFKPIVKLYVQ